MKKLNFYQTNARKRRLVNTYRKYPQIGIFLGAGATISSKVPSYPELALNLLQTASEHTNFDGDREWARNFIQDQRTRIANNRKIIPPEDVVLYVRSHLGSDKKTLRELIQHEIYKNAAVRKTVKRDAFEKNETLDAILTFCAARPHTGITTDPNLLPMVNPKIGGILTTNYDNLVESAFHTKFRQKLLKPIGRPTTSEFDIMDRQTISVYHMHGYVGFKKFVEDQEDKPTPEIVIAEDDYFETFYDPMGFGNYIALSFFRRFPCLFIGASMEDKNIRRILFHLVSASKRQNQAHQRKFAILKKDEELYDSLLDQNLLYYGVETIWIDRFSDIPEILRELYINAKHPEKTKKIFTEDWEFLKKYKWPKKREKLIRNNLSSLLTEHNWSQAYVAEYLGVSTQTINALENEKYIPSLPLAIKIADLFDLKIEEIFEAS